MSKETINELMGRVVRSPMPLRRPATYSPSAELNQAADLTALASNLSRPQSYGYGSASQIPRPNTAAPAPPRPAPVAPAPAGGSNPYGFAASGSSEDTAANFFAADQRMRQAQQAQQAQAARPAPAPAPKPVPPPSPMRRPEPTPDASGETGAFAAAAAIPKKATPVDKPTAFDVNGWKGATNPVGGVKPSFAQADYDPMNKKPFEPTKPKNITTSSTPKLDTNQGPGEDWPKGTAADMKPAGLNTKPPKLDTNQGPGEDYPVGTTADMKRAGYQSESGTNKKEKDKKMSESTLINAFLKLQATEHSNIFEAAKKAKKDWDKDGKIESGKDEYLGSKIAAAKKAGKMEEELKGGQKNLDKNHNGELDKQDFEMLRGDKKSAKSEKMKAYRADRDKHGEMEEEVEFSEAELAHFEAVIARKDQKGKEKGIGDTVDSADLTDEYINEMAQRGVKAGQKRGSYKKKATDLQGNRAAAADAEPDEGSKGVPHVLDQIRHGHEDEHGFKSITHPASSPDAPVTKKIHRSELHGFYDRYHNTEKPAAKEKEYSSFLGKHFGDERSSAPTSKAVTLDNTAIAKSNAKGNGVKVSLGGSSRVGGSK
jgi:hypothetical protein